MIVYLGENIKKQRKEKNITQEVLAEHLGVTFQSVSNWERGESYPDITMLPDIANFFNITIDSLIGMNEIEKQKKIDEYLNIYDKTKYKDTSFVFEKFCKAAKEFPTDFRILVRYMELLMCEKSSADEPEYENYSREINSIYKNIQSHCTDDNIRMWSKRLMCQHLHTKAHYKNNDEYQIKCESLLSEMPDMINTKDYLSTMLITDKEKHYAACGDSIENLLFLLKHSVDHYCLYDEAFALEYRIEALEKMLKVYDIFFTDKNYGKLWPDVIYNHGHLLCFYDQLNNFENAVKHLGLCVKFAIEYDNLPQFTERNAQFFERRIFEKVPRGKTMCHRMKYLITEKYSLSEKLKDSKEYRLLIKKLDNKDI